MGVCLTKLKEAGFDVTKDGKIFRNGKQLKTFKKKNGYHSIRVSVENKRKSYHVHRLVALFHIGDPKDLTVNHKDGDKSNNHLDNLEIVTLKRNIQLAVAKPVVGFKNGKGIYYPSVRSAEADGFDASAICKVIKGKFKHYRGYQWAYA